MMPVYCTTELRAIEAQFTQQDLPQLAAQATANWVSARYPHGSTLLIAAGTGYNGVDALLSAQILQTQGYGCYLLCLGDIADLPATAQTAYEACINAGALLLDEVADEPPLFDLVIDGLFGIGLNRPLSGDACAIISWINQLGSPILALDIPSGLHPDTGCALGVAIQADATLSFIGLKPGLLTGQQSACCGQVWVDHLGLSADELPPSQGYALSAQSVKPLIPSRTRSSHKGTHGTTAILGGAQGMMGAALLAGRAALYTGAGKVQLGVIDPHIQVDPQQVELQIYAGLSVLENNPDAIGIGCGLGQSSQAISLLEWALRSPAPVVLDADALNLMAQYPAIADLLRARKHASIITPHPAEAARLLHTSTESIENHRIRAAISLAAEFNCIAVLKGAGSIVAFADGEYCINTTGNPALANAGQGDVLTGIITALLAQGLQAGDAALTGVCLHGAAADACVQQTGIMIGHTATETIVSARQVLNQWLASVA